MGHLRQSTAAVLALVSATLIIGFVDAQGPTTGVWQSGSATGAIAAGPAAVVLADGRILVTGYTPITGAARSTVAIYNPVTGAWTSAGHMLQARTGHTATMLPNGLVLIAGGKVPLPGGAYTISGSFELFDQATGTSTAVIGVGLAIPRTGHAAALLQDGKVLFVGGSNNLGVLDVAEIYDPSANPVTLAVTPVSSPMLPGRTNLSATTLPNGQVLLAGGRDSRGIDLSLAQIYDPAAQTFSPVASVPTARSKHAAVLLGANHQVLVFGGVSNGSSLSSAAMYNAATDTWTATASMAAPRVGALGAATAEGGAIAIGGGPSTAEFFRFVSLPPGDPTGGTGGGTPPSGGTGTTPPADSGQLLDFPNTGHPSLPGGGTFGYPFIEVTNSVQDHVHENELFGSTTYDGATLAFQTYPQWLTFASAPDWHQTGSLAQATDENLSISPCNQPGTFTDINHNGVQDFWEDTNFNGRLDPSEDVNGNNQLDAGEDTNNNGKLDLAEDVNGNGLLDLEPPIECGRFEIRAQVDHQGHLVGTGTDTDVLMRGHIIKEHFDPTLNRFVTDIDINGTLLTGRIVEFGFQNPSATDAVLPSFCPFGSTKDGGVCRAADGSTSQPMCQPGFSANADGSCHSPAARFQFKVAVTGGLLVNPAGSPAWCVQPSCFINPIDRLDASLQLGIDVMSANVSGTLASGALNGYASATAGPLARVAGLSPTTTTLTVVQPAPYTYNGTPFTATAVATASDGLNVPVPVVYTGDCTHVTAAGCTATATYIGDSSHADSSATQTIAIVPRPITFKADNVTRTYGETTPAFSYSAAAGSVVPGDAFGAPVFAPAGSSAGSHALVLSGLSNPDYAITFAPGILTVTPRQLTFNVLAEDKVYDGNRNATVTLGSDAFPGDIFSITYASASFADKNVGMERSVEVTGISIAGADAANYTFSTTATTTADITPRALTVTATGDNKVYDGNTSATVTLRDDRISGDALTTAYTSAAFSDKNAGNGKTVTINGISVGGADRGNYTVTAPVSTTANITGRQLTITATGDNKVYDATTAATVTLRDDRVAGDALTTSYTSAVFADKNVGNGKTVTISGIALGGTDVGNYTVTAPASTTANITPRQLTLTATGDNKIYDGTTAATVTLRDDRIAGDVLTRAYTSAVFADKNVGNGKTVTISGIAIGGTDVGNYTVNAPASTTANITRRQLTITATGNNKVYDGTRTAAVTLGDNRVSGDLLTAAYTSAVFADGRVGVAKPVDVSGISITGADSGNYLANTTTSTTADITARALLVTATGVSKIYDGNAAATVTLGDDRLKGDVITVAYTAATFANKSVGTGKTVSVSGISIDGADKANYIANTTASTTANITTKLLTIAASGVNKVYDGTTAATVTLTDDRFAGDTLTAAYTSAAFADKNAGTGKTVSVSGISINGGDAGNYSANTTASATANITLKQLTVTAAGIAKVYDGNATATVTLSDNRLTGDVLTAAYTAATFANKSIGIGKAVSVSGISISGGDAGNYSANATASTSANITPRQLVVTATGIDKVYDGTTTAAVTLSHNALPGDAVTANYTSAVFDNVNVGLRGVAVGGITAGGADGNNYTPNATASTKANITARPLTVSAAGLNKVYDGTQAAAVTLSDDRVAGDTFATSYAAATFADKNAGVGKAVSVTGIALGAGATNYALSNTTASTTANITTRPVVVSATGVNKVYDGTTAATVTLSDDRVPGDGFTTSYGAATFANKNAGGGKTVSVTGIALGGTGFTNYTLSNTTASTTATITTRPLVVSATAGDKVYDRTTTATVTLSTNALPGDVVTANYSAAAFDSAIVGLRNVSVTSITVGGTDGGNYTPNATASTKANITARPLTVTASGVNKAYDGTTTATVTLGDNRIAGDVFSATYTTATFADENVGTGKVVTVSGIGISGGDAGNYSANATASTTASITRRQLAVTATGIDKVYDGNTTATVTLGDNRVSGDVLAATYTSAAFADKSAGANKVVTVSGISISGGDANNYNFNTAASTTASITRRQLSVTATGINKVYDGTPAATVTLGDNRISGDVLTATYTAAAFANENVGTGKTVSVSGIGITGGDAGNYNANATASTTANITQRQLAITATGVDKVYDGNPTATVTLGDNRVSGDLVTASYTTAVFADENAGTNKVVTVSGIGLTGGDAGNYTANTSASTTASITRRQLMVTATAVNKVYDGTTAATVTLSDDRLTGDVLTSASTSAAFADANVGNGKTVTVSGITLAGTDSVNYNVSPTTTTAANITAKAASVTPNVASKIYGAADPAFTGSLAGFLPGDAVTASYSRTAGETVAGSPYAISATLAPAAVLGNYAITYNTANFSIAKATASVSAAGGSFTYDGTPRAGNGSATGGRGESLPVTLSYTGTGSTTYGPVATAPTNAGTYTVVASTTGDGNNNGASSSPAALTINKATATVTLSGLTKTFNGSAQSPTATTTPAGLPIVLTGAPQTNAGSYPVMATVNDANYQGSASGTFVITATAPTVTSTLAVSNLTPQYSDQETFTVTVSSSIPGQPAAGVNFFVGSQQVGNPAPVTVPLVAVGDPATSTTYKAVWTGELLEPTPTGQMKPGGHVVSAAFVNPNFSMANPANKSVNITREDARIGGLDRTSYSLGGSATGIVPLTVTVKDITAMVGDAAFDAFAGDIRGAQVQFIDRATNAVIGTANVSTLIGSGTTTGTATLNWSVNLGTATSKNYTIGFTLLNYYIRSQTADNVVITVSK